MALFRNTAHVWCMFKGAAVAAWLSSWLAEQEDRDSIPAGLANWIFRDWWSPASKLRYGWKIAKSTLILKTVCVCMYVQKHIHAFNVHFIRYVYSQTTLSVHEKLHELHSYFPPIAKRTPLIITSSCWKSTDWRTGIQYWSKEEV